MSDNFEYIDPDDDDYFDAPKALRDHVKRLQERLQETTQQRDDFRTKFQQRSVSDVLSDQGFKNPERVARDILADGVDPSNEKKVREWLEENSDDYAKKVQPESGTEATAQETPEQSATPETQSGLEAIQRTTQGAAPAGHDAYAAAHAEIDNHPEWDADQVRKFLVQKGL